MGQILLCRKLVTTIVVIRSLMQLRRHKADIVFLYYIILNDASDINLHEESSYPHIMCHLILFYSSSVKLLSRGKAGSFG